MPDAPNACTFRSRSTARQPLFLHQLEPPRQIVSNRTPNWYAPIIGTSAFAVSDLQIGGPIVRALAVSASLIATAPLVGLSTATAVHSILRRNVARCHHVDPVSGHFYCAPALALLTVGASALLVGRDVLRAGMTRSRCGCGTG